MKGVVLLLLLAGCLATEGGDEGAAEVQSSEHKELCSRHCDSTYPEHTYPSPQDHVACARGCRMAKVNALIAWPFQSDTSNCLEVCREGYASNDSQTYACIIGCNASTIDQMIPDRDRFYPMETSTDESGPTEGLLDSFRKQIPQLFVLSYDIAALQQHADRIMTLLPCNSVVYIENGAVVEIQYRAGVEYSDFQSPDYLVMEEQTYSDSSSSSYPSYYICPWRAMRQASTTRFLFFIGTCLIMAALLTCCCASCMADEEEEEEEKEKKTPQPPPMKHYSEVFIDTSVKSPLTFAVGYPQPYSSTKKYPIP